MYLLVAVISQELLLYLDAANAANAANAFNGNSHGCGRWGGGTDGSWLTGSARWSGFGKGGCGCKRNLQDYKVLPILEAFLSEDPLLQSGTDLSRDVHEASDASEASLKQLV